MTHKRSRWENGKMPYFKIESKYLTKKDLFWAVGKHIHIF